MATEKLKVFNDRKHDIGVTTMNGQSYNIRPGSFILLSEDDIAYIESQCRYDKKLFGGGKLRVGVDNEERLEEIGIYKADQNFLPERHDIEEKLSGSAKTIKEWMTDITDKAILFEIFEVAKEMDLSASKMRAVKEMLPDSVILGED